MSNLPHLGKAIVIGASISGLLAARVLADHFAEVIVVERDTQPPIGEARKGVPQGRHAHVLLARGREQLEELFPGLTHELVNQGAVAGDLSEMSRWFSNGVYTKNFRSGLLGMQVSRPLLEGTIYQRLQALPNITIVTNHDAVGLLSEANETNSAQRVTGIKVIDRGQSAASEQSLYADLVVDASGRGTRSLTWLESLGYARPAEEHIKMSLSYTTREFRRLPEHAQGHSPIVILTSFNNRRAAAMLAVEGDRWIVTLAGFLGDAAPADLEGFIEYARSLNAPDCYDIIKNAQPIGEASQFKYPASQRRYFEKLPRFPEGLVVVGDALCSFNPIYGQGMTTAANEAGLIGKCLKDGLPGIGQRFFRQASPMLDSPWSIAAGSDLAFPEVEGKRAPAMRMVGKYLDWLLKASAKDNNLNIAFQRVTNLIDPPASLFRPSIVLRVLIGNLKQ